MPCLWSKRTNSLLYSTDMGGFSAYRPIPRGVRVGSMTNVVERLAQSVTSANVTASYGDKVTIGGVEVIPVALVGFGFGGGGDDGDNGGGGGTAGSVPIGVYVGGPDGVRFRPNPIALLAVSIPVAWVVGRSLVRIVKAFKK